MPTIVDRCRALSRRTAQPGRITRTFLSPPVHEVHRMLREWMEPLGMVVHVDAAGNLRGTYPGVEPGAPRFLIGSHIDTVPDAGAFDGILGVILGIALIEALQGRRLRFAIEVIAFSEEEGVRFGTPFLGSRALIGTLDDTLLARRDRDGITIRDAIRDFGLDPEQIPQAALGGNVRGYLEFHIEQGPVLGSLGLPLGVVDTIVGQSRHELCFTGKANHAGTTPMRHRRDALAGAAEWIGLVEEKALATLSLVATVGRIQAAPGAGNVIAGEVRATLDVRHPYDEVRLRAVEGLLAAARDIGLRRALSVECETHLNHPAVPCDPGLRSLLERAVERAGFPIHRMPSGAGHDAMVLAAKVPVAMLFLRSPGGISHHPDETVLPSDVDAALRTGLRFLDLLEESNACIDSD